MNCKEKLKEYIDKDEIYQDYKQNKLMNPSDFDKFCIQHCKDIEELLEENLELEQALDDTEKILRQPQFEYDNIPCNYEDDIEKIKEIIQKAKGEWIRVEIERTDIILKIREDVDLNVLEKYGFKRNSNFPDGWAMVKTYKKSRYYQEDIYVWNDRTIQVNAIELNDTIYDLIKADLVVKVEE